MKRGLVFTLCAMAVAASATIAQVQTITCAEPALHRPG